MADDSVSATTTIGASAEVVFAVLADPARHAAIEAPAGSAGRSTTPHTAAGSVPDGDVPPEPSGRELRDRQPGRGVRTADRHRMETRIRTSVTAPWLRWLDLALRPQAAGPSRTKVTLTYDWSAVSEEPGHTSGSHRSRQTIWATPSPTSPTWPFVTSTAVTSPSASSARFRPKPVKTGGTGGRRPQGAPTGCPEWKGSPGRAWNWRACPAHLPSGAGSVGRGVAAVLLVGVTLVGVRLGTPAQAAGDPVLLAAGDVGTCNAAGQLAGSPAYGQVPAAPTRRHRGHARRRRLPQPGQRPTTTSPATPFLGPARHQPASDPAPATTSTTAAPGGATTSPT